MFEIVDKHLNNIKKILDNDIDLSKMKALKSMIYEDNSLKKILDNSNTEDSYKLIELRKEVFNHPLVQEYKALENKLIYITMEINQKLNELVR